jgi:hypothetical protein
MCTEYILIPSVKHIHYSFLYRLNSWFGKMRVRSTGNDFYESCMFVCFYFTVGVATHMIDAWPSWTAYMFDEHVRHSIYTGISVCRTPRNFKQVWMRIPVWRTGMRLPLQGHTCSTYRYAVAFTRTYKTTYRYVEHVRHTGMLNMHVHVKVTLK